MADPAQKGNADKHGAWYLAYRSGDTEDAWRWKIEYTDTDAAGVALGESPYVDSAEVDPASVYESKADAVAAAKKFAENRAKLDAARAKAAAPAPAPAKSKAKGAPAPADDDGGDSGDAAS